MTEGDNARLAAMVLWMSRNKIKLVHAWPLSNYWNAMAEWPIKPRKKLPTEKHVTGTGSTRAEAIEQAIEKLGFGGVKFKLFVLEYQVAYLNDLLRKGLRGGKASQ